MTKLILPIGIVIALTACQSSVVNTGDRSALAAGRSPAAVCDAKDFGATGDGRTDDTGAIQAAIDRCANGGVVRLRDGVFIAGTLRLRSGLELRIETGAVLKGSVDDRRYPDLRPPVENTQLHDCRKTLLYAESVKGLLITGGGTIDGSGHNPKWTGKEATRPMAIFVALSQDVRVESLKIKDAGMWGVVAFESDDLVFRHLDIDSLIHPNRDGIDIVDSHHVLIEDSSVIADDDAICLKSGSAKGVEDVIVRRVRVIRTDSNALKIGTASTGYFKNILFDDIEIDRAAKAAMVVLSVDGGRASDVHFQNIRFRETAAAIFVLLGRRLFSLNVGSIENIYFDHIVGTTNQTWGSAISGTAGLFTEYVVKGVHLNDVRVRQPAAPSTAAGEPPEYDGRYPDPGIWGDLPTDSVYVRHATDVTMKDTHFETVR